MPSSTRKQRANSGKQKQHQEQLRFPDDPAQTPSQQASQRSAPHPYHENLPPPPPAMHGPFQQRSSSSESKLSDISMDDFDKNSVLDSVLEYSDTSDDMREDSYFMPEENPYAPPGSLLGPGNQYHHHGDGQRQQHRRNSNQLNLRAPSGESAFRELRSVGAKSSKIVRFKSGGSLDSSSFGSEPSPSACSGGADDELSPRSGGVRGTSANNDRTDNHHQDNPKIGGWMKKVAYAFRSPSGIPHKKADTAVDKVKHSNRGRRGNDGEPNETHQRIPSSNTVEFPFSMFHLGDPSHPSSSAKATPAASASYETSPLLVRSHKKTPSLSGSDHPGYGGATNHNRRYSAAATSSDFFPLKANSAATSAKIGIPSSMGRRNHQLDDGMEKVEDGVDAIEMSRPDHYVFRSRTVASSVSAYFLMDYEASRPPTLQPNFETITTRQLYLYRIHFSWQWRWFVNLAILGLFLSHTQNRLSTAIMHSCVIAIFAIEMQMTEMMYGIDPSEDRRHPERNLVRPMTAFLFLLGLESWMWYLLTDDMEPNRSSPPLISSIFKPLVFFYVSAKARDSLEALWRISRIVSRVLIIEFGLILTFAAVGCRLFGAKHESFRNLSTSWLSLFECKPAMVIVYWIYRISGSQCETLTLTMIILPFLISSVDDGCQSKSLDADVPVGSISSNFFRCLHHNLFVLLSFPRLVGCIPNIHSSGDGDSRAIIFGS